MSPKFIPTENHSLVPLTNGDSPEDVFVTDYIMVKSSQSIFTLKWLCLPSWYNVMKSLSNSSISPNIILGCVTLYFTLTESSAFVNAIG